MDMSRCGTPFEHDGRDGFNAALTVLNAASSRRRTATIGNTSSLFKRQSQQRRYGSPLLVTTADVTISTTSSNNPPSITYRLLRTEEVEGLCKEVKALCGSTHLRRRAQLGHGANRSMINASDGSDMPRLGGMIAAYLVHGVVYTPKVVGPYTLYLLQPSLQLSQANSSFRLPAPLGSPRLQPTPWRGRPLLSNV
ncbi:hypothetical protein FRC09_010804 [Ceratobasidium sp. 395]|nr:hypothetical protein FRC09_010804 [Ceratobasidium sp. 395]